MAEVKILSGKNVELKTVEEKIFKWCEPSFKTVMTLEFAECFEIRHVDWDEGIRDCVYQINEKTFTDLSCMKGEVKIKFPSTRDDYSYQIRQNSDGEKFLRYWEEIPTFDSGDRDWDSDKLRALYVDSKGINLIHCHVGYQLPYIKICVGLKKASPAIIRWLNYIGCPRKKFPKIG